MTLVMPILYRYYYSRFFSLEKWGIINFVPKSVYRPSVTFLNVSPKSLDIATSNFVAAYVT